MTEEKESRAVTLMINGKKRVFDIDDPALPDWVDDYDLKDGGYPYDKKLNREKYEDKLLSLQEELVKLQDYLQATGERAIIVFEGRDAAGKGGSIKALTAFLNPRNTRIVALPKPTDAERGQWYFQRYVSQFPTTGEMVVFDRSWYNRGGVEPVMGFCTPEQHKIFLDDVSNFEKMVVEEGIHFIKFWLNIGQTTQLKRFHDRRHSKLKSWKLSGIDIKGIEKWDAYTAARDEMMKASHSKHAPWAVVRYNDKRRGRIAVIQHILGQINHAGRDLKRVGKPDEKILGSGPAFLGGKVE